MIGDASSWLLKLIIPLSVGVMAKFKVPFRWLCAGPAMTDPLPSTGSSAPTDPSSSIPGQKAPESNKPIGPNEEGPSGGSTRGSDGSVWLHKLFIPLSSGIMLKFKAPYYWLCAGPATSDEQPHTAEPSGPSTGLNIIENSSPSGTNNDGAFGGSTCGSGADVSRNVPIGAKTENLSNGGAICRPTCKICDVIEAPKVDSRSPVLVELKHPLTKDQEEFLRLAIFPESP